MALTRSRVSLPGFEGAPAGPPQPPCKLREVPWESPYACPPLVTGQLAHLRSGPGSAGLAEDIAIERVQVRARHGLGLAMASPRRRLW